MSLPKKVGVIQSSYIPWRGYFDFIASVDLFVLYDDVQYSHGTWRNRNQVKTSAGLRWLTVPVKPGSTRLPIDQVKIGCPEDPWHEAHRRLLHESLKGAPFFKDALQLWEPAIGAQDELLSGLNLRLIRGICAYLGIDTPIVLSRDFGIDGRKTERLIELLRRLGASTYVSGPTARGYLDEESFRRNDIRLEYKNYEYDPYPQLWGEFVGTVTVLDLIANTGPRAREFLRCRAPNTPAIT